jgi:hypothetical protein
MGKQNEIKHCQKNELNDYLIIIKKRKKEDEMRWLNTRFQRSTWWLAYWSLSRTHGTQQDSNKCMAVYSRQEKSGSCCCC